VAPVGTLVNGISIYSSAGEAYIMDAAGNTTLQSPHDPSTNYWIFDSKNTDKGTSLTIDMEQMMKQLNATMGWDYVHETINGVVTNSETPTINLAELNLNLEAISGTITPLSGSPSESFVTAFFNNVFAKVTTWMGEAGNGIGDFFANRVHTKELCVAKSDGTEFCANGDQLEAMVSNDSNNSISTPDPISTPTPEPTPVPEPESISTSSPTPEPASGDLVPILTPEPALEPAS
jgi:hypothetical protein